jgi:hypothetical protein
MQMEGENAKKIVCCTIILTLSWGGGGHNSYQNIDSWIIALGLELIKKIVEVL